MRRGWHDGCGSHSCSCCCCCWTCGDTFNIKHIINGINAWSCETLSCPQTVLLLQCNNLRKTRNHHNSYLFWLVHQCSWTCFVNALVNVCLIASVNFTMSPIRRGLSVYGGCVLGSTFFNSSTQDRLATHFRHRNCLTTIPLSEPRKS
jgi:hypothetical protein